MTAFKWNQNFVTGLGEVDSQHQRLVQLINELGDMLGENQFTQADLESLLGELADYAKHHFSEEETLMARAGIDPRHLQAHEAAHAGFLEEVALLQAGLQGDSAQAAMRLLDYLTHWLAFHILGQDQNMAAQLGMIAAGASPAEAFATKEAESAGATEPLLAALSGLFAQVSERNRELVKLAQELEARVQRRTSALVEANRKLEVLSLTDVLTGLPNRRHAMARLDALWEESCTGDHALACMMLDADHFKAVNDTHGHDAGDHVLVEFAVTVRDALRNDDLVFRLGGDEFLVVCPRTGLAGALQVAEKVLQAIRALDVPVGHGRWRGSASIGVAVKTAEMAHYDELILVADRNVYEAKQAGRNCVRS
ncbi:GGDEF domain-containing protein [Thioalkalivibrio sp. XN279]|uniref:GGDEF domain-containing protein n=1 Tax=Thioalkalivibrio sp. XN279 TaxID=2714953 RepID=UPI00140B7C0F|nr:GGDEF domain-containing protein [Thioalkalivibrio sp. XN279]NHA13397.1 bacteriohemerythrin [Thioalkalivibrio sp. XN279]